MGMGMRMRALRGRFSPAQLGKSLLHAVRQVESPLILLPRAVLHIPQGLPKPSIFTSLPRPSPRLLDRLSKRPSPLLPLDFHSASPLLNSTACRLLPVCFSAHLSTPSHLAFDALCGLQTCLRRAPTVGGGGGVKDNTFLWYHGTGH